MYVLQVMLWHTVVAVCVRREHLMMSLLLWGEQRWTSVLSFKLSVTVSFTHTDMSLLVFLHFCQLKACPTDVHGVETLRNAISPLTSVLLMAERRRWRKKCCLCWFKRERDDMDRWFPATPEKSSRAEATAEYTVPFREITPGNPSRPEITALPVSSHRLWHAWFSYVKP